MRVLASSICSLNKWTPNKCTPHHLATLQPVKSKFTSCNCCFHVYGICMSHPCVWDLYIWATPVYGICMSHPCVWHLYVWATYVSVSHPGVWKLYVTHMYGICMSHPCVWDLYESPLCMGSVWLTHPYGTKWLYYSPFLVNKVCSLIQLNSSIHWPLLYLILREKQMIEVWTS